MDILEALDDLLQKRDGYNDCMNDGTGRIELDLYNKLIDEYETALKNFKDRLK